MDQNINRSKEPNGSRKVRVVLIGDANVGKSTLCQALKGNVNEFVRTASTIGAEFSCVLTDNNIRFELWDTAGQERYQALVPLYYRHADIFLLVFDVSQRTTFNSIERWITSIQQYNRQTITEKDCDAQRSIFPIVLIANKIDLLPELQVLHSPCSNTDTHKNDDEYNLFQSHHIDNIEATMKAEEHEIPLCCTSATKGFGITKLKETLESYANPTSNEENVDNIKEANENFAFFDLCQPEFLGDRNCCI